MPLTRRSNSRMRVFAAESGGNVPTPVYFGGLDTVRGFDLYSIVGDRGFFTNVECASR